MKDCNHERRRHGSSYAFQADDVTKVGPNKVHPVSDLWFKVFFI